MAHGTQLRNSARNAAHFRPSKGSQRKAWSEEEVRKVARDMYDAVCPIDGTVLGHFFQLEKRGAWGVVTTDGEVIDRRFPTSAYILEALHGPHAECQCEQRCRSGKKLRLDPAE